MEPLKQTEDRIRQTKPDIQTPASMDSRILTDSYAAMGSKPSSVIPPGHNKFRKIFMKTPIKLTAAAVIVVAFLAGIYQLTGSIDGASVALADVADKMKQIQSCVFEKTTTAYSGSDIVQTSRSLVYYKKGNIRADMFDNEKVSKVIYVDFQEGVLVFVDHQMKVFDEKQLTDEDIEKGTLISPDKIVDFLLSEGDYKNLGRKTIDGVLSEGFELHSKKPLLSMDSEKVDNFDLRLWVDVNINLPIRFEVDAVLYNNIKVEVVQNDPQWNVELEDGFFEPKIPDDYIKLQDRGLLGINLENWPALKVNPGTAADKAGIKDGDVVLKVDGKSIEHIKSPNEAQGYLFGKAGEKVTLTVKRGEQIISIDVVREPLPLE